jgi:hypothetical protein
MDALVVKINLSQATTYSVARVAIPRMIRGGKPAMLTDDE